MRAKLGRGGVVVAPLGGSVLAGERARAEIDGVEEGEELGEVRGGLALGEEISQSGVKLLGAGRRRLDGALHAMGGGVGGGGGSRQTLAPRGRGFDARAEIRGREGTETHLELRFDVIDLVLDALRGRHCPRSGAPTREREYRSSAARGSPHRRGQRSHGRRRGAFAAHCGALRTPIAERFVLFSPGAAAEASVSRFCERVLPLTRRW